jgi:hypothetical protein
VVEHDDEELLEEEDDDDDDDGQELTVTFNPWYMILKQPEARSESQLEMQIPKRQVDVHDDELLVLSLQINVV